MTTIDDLMSRNKELENKLRRATNALDDAANEMFDGAESLAVNGLTDQAKVLTAAAQRAIDADRANRP